MDIAELSRSAARFQKTLAQTKRDLESPDLQWYPYDSFAVFSVLERMLRDERRDLLGLTGAAPLLDIGCGDGDLSFFFESTGCPVVAVDNLGPNFNQTRGFATLKRALGSSAELMVRDLDQGLQFGGRTYGLSLFLGVLYHLKNPFGVLETLAKHIRYCVLSTRIAQMTPRGASVQEDAIAYLLDPLEANHDPSNYWIFSQAGLRRILGRTGWEICDYTSTGFVNGSTPSDERRDERAFCMLRSNLPDPWPGVDVDLNGGWHAMEEGSWRWTERAFSVIAKRTADAATLRFRFLVHEAVLASVGPVRLRALLNSEALPVCEYSSAGEHTYEQKLPPCGENLSIRFELDKALGPTDSDRRELGVQVVFWGTQGNRPHCLNPIALLE